MFEFGTRKELLLNFQKLTVKQRLEWWADAFEFISKLPEETRQKQLYFRNKRNQITEKN